MASHCCAGDQAAPLLLALLCGGSGRAAVAGFAVRGIRPRRCCWVCCAGDQAAPLLLGLLCEGSGRAPVAEFAVRGIRPCRCCGVLLCGGSSRAAVAGFGVHVWGVRGRYCCARGAATVLTTLHSPCSTPRPLCYCDQYMYLNTLCSGFLNPPHHLNVSPFTLYLQIRPPLRTPTFVRHPTPTFA